MKPFAHHGYLTLEHETLPVWVHAKPRSPVIRLSVPAKAVLDLAVACLDEKSGRCSGTIEVRSVSGSPQARDIPLVFASKRRWLRQRIALDDFSGTEIALQLAASAPHRLAASAPRVCAGGGARNVLLVVIDTLRADALGAYGGTWLTPVLDRLSRMAETFTETRATSSWTMPSVATILTGRMPHEVGMTRPMPFLDLRSPTLAAAIERRGVHAWLLSGNPTVGVASHLHLGFGRAFARRRADIPARELTRIALNWIDEAADHPLFLYVHYMDPHSPYAGSLSEAERAYNHGLRPRLAAAELSELRRRYQEDVSEVDRALAPLLIACRSPRWAVVVTSDHGEEFFEHGAILHGQSLYEEQLRVPLLVQVPDRAASLRTDPVSLASLAPTLARLAGASLDGEDLWAAAARRSTRGAAETRSLLPSGEHRHLRSAWEGARKVVRDLDTGETRHFDLSADPLERAPLPLPPDLEERLSLQLAAWPDSATSPLAPPLELEEALKQLGYLR